MYYSSYTMYEPEPYLTPYWRGNLMYDESLMFVPDPVTHKISPAPLMFQPDEILSVRSSDFKTSYIPEQDYILQDGMIVRTEHSRMPVWDYDEYYLREPAAISINSLSAAGRYVLFADGSVFAEKQIVVTYRHHEKWAAAVPLYCQTQLAQTLHRLQTGKPVTIVYYGDSIMEGCEASGQRNQAPYMPIFSQMATRQLRKIYPKTIIRDCNTAVGGTTSEWGRSQALQRVAAYAPDLVVINFGMNDSVMNILVAQYEENLRSIIQTTRRIYPKAEFLLISSSFPSPDCAGWTGIQGQYQDALENIVQTVPGTALIPMTEMHRYLLQKKRYADICGNGVNHPNDFVARMYAQAILCCLSNSNADFS